MTIDEMKKRKKELGYTYEMISELSGIPLGTVQKIFCGVTKVPRYATRRALESVFSDRGTAGDKNSQQKKQGEYTIEDYYALPEERRVELINGVFYDMASPTSVHQSILTFISNTIFNHIQKNKGGCRVFAAPLDVQLNMDDRTMVQPDILVICSREKYKDGHIYGAPDLAIEILSPSTRGRDLVLKLNKYCEAGVREYWTVDPESKEVTVFTFQEEIESVVYGIPDVVPVGIFEDSCGINLKELFDYAEF